MDNPAVPQKSMQDGKFLNALADAFRLQEAVLNSTPFAIISTTPGGTITSFNRAAEHLLGYSCEEIIGKADPLRFHDADEVIAAARDILHDTYDGIEPRFDLLIRTLQSDEHNPKREWTLVKKDGQKFPACVSVTALRDEDGRLTGYVVIAEDISERKLAQEKVFQAQAQLEKIAEENFRVFNNPVNLNAIADFDGYFKRLSPSWTTLLGWTTDELKSKPFIEFVHPEDTGSTRNATALVEAGNNPVTFENRFRSRDGSYKWLLWGSSFDMKDRNIYASAVDITERKKSELELLRSKKDLEDLSMKLQEQNRQLDEFAHIISHNLRSPLGNIQALVNLLDEGSSISDYRLIFDKLKNVAKNLAETMNDLMETIKAKASTNIERYEVRFKDVLDKIIQSLEGDLIHAEASVTFDFNSAPSLFYPKHYLDSILLNLISNSLKYRSASRKLKIHVQTSNDRGQIELSVSDNGLGIDLNKFGDKLFGLHKTFHGNDEAKGVGLFLIKTQIQSLGGSIHVESEVDKGTIFIIRF